MYLHTNSQRSHHGFTLIEIAVVLVIIGLLIGATLVGAEMITSAKTRSLIAEIDGAKGAFFGFSDRYRALPGDFSQATSIVFGTTASGDGDGRIRSQAQGAVIDEHIAVWEHLARAGYVSGGFVYAAGTPTNASAPRSRFGGFPMIQHNNNYAGVATARNVLFTGTLVPANVMAELDRKLDDGLATTGSLRFSSFDVLSAPPIAANCYLISGPDAGPWRITGSVESNCGGAILFM